MCLASIVMSDASSALIVDFGSSTAEITRSKPPPDRLLAGSPEHTARNYFSDSTGRFFAGTWESTPGRWRVRYSENEFCHITQGRVVIEDEQSRRWEFKAGDSFVIASGFSGTWHVIETLRKLYVIHEPAS
jgi:uncharacterized cupin superfamily protein